MAFIALDSWICYPCVYSGSNKGDKIHEHFMHNLQSVKFFLCLISQDSILNYGKRRYSYTHIASRQYTRMGDQLQDSATLPLWESLLHTLTSNSLSSSHLCLDLPGDLFPFTKTLYASLSPIGSTFSAHPIFFTSFTLVVFDQGCKHRSVSFSNTCNFFLRC